jgi:pimeloyl-ACP methyl ester carboxylesterase
MSLTLLLLPGIHGGSKLFERFLAALPDWITPRVVTYPADRIVNYDDILAGIELPSGPFALLAESYAGPLGIRIAASQPQNLQAVIFVATFARSPHPYVPRWAAGAFQGWMFGLPIQRNACRRLLLRDDGTCEELDEGWAELFVVNPAVLAARVREVLRVDVRDQIQQIRVPTLYLRASRDVVVPARATRDIQQRMPGMKIVTLDTPHPVLQRRPAKSAAAVAEFLARVAKPQA